MQTTWFPRLVAWCGSSLGCKCLIAQPAALCEVVGCVAACSYSCMMEANLPTWSWRGNGSQDVGSCLIDRERGCLASLLHWNGSSLTSSTCSAHDGPSPAPPVSIGAGREEVAIGASAGISSMMAGSTTGASATGASAIGVSTMAVSATGTTIASALGLLELGTWVSALICDSWQDSLGANWGHLGKGAPSRCGHSRRWPWWATTPW